MSRKPSKQTRDKRKRRSETTARQAERHAIDAQQPRTEPDTTLPETNDAGDAISEASLYAASGAATGGGVDTPQAVVESTEEVTRRQKHIHQGISAYPGGGADNGTNL